MYKVLNEENDVFALKCVNLKDLPKSQLQDYVNEVRLLDYEIDTQAKKLNIVVPSLSPEV